MWTKRKGRKIKKKVQKKNIKERRKASKLLGFLTKEGEEMRVIQGKKRVKKERNIGK